MAGEGLSDLMIDPRPGETHRPGEVAVGSIGLVDDTAVALSVVVNIVGGERALRRCLTRLAPQVDGQPIEIIVPFDQTTRWATGLQREFPTVFFADMGG